MAIDLNNPSPELLAALEQLVTDKAIKDKTDQRQNLIDVRDAEIRTETNKVTNTIIAKYQLLIDAIV